ncbi:HAMP domain-containing sensor histidine kinase [Lachnospiraceae bacterium JLR.KK009]|jgi:signal transduction histidine kinase
MKKYGMEQGAQTVRKGHKAMEIKWKETELKQKAGNLVKKVLKRDEIFLIPGIVGTVLGFLILSDILSYRYNITEANLGQGSMMNLCFAAGVAGLYQFGLRYANRGWSVQNENFFQEWEWKERRIKIFTGILALAALVAAIANFHYRLKHSWVYGNLSSGYIPVGTVALQWGIAVLTVNRYMKKKLKLYMENLEQINQRSLESALRSEQMKVDLISNVSHDLKTPLTSMVGYIELMKKEELSDILSDYTEVLSRKAQKLKEMIDSLFDLAKTSSGNVELHMEQMEMNCLVEQVQADMADRIGESGREFVVMLTEEPTDFVADSGYMYRIIQNLMENALKYSQEHTRIFLKSSVLPAGEGGGLGDPGQKVRFEITNTSSYQMNFTREQIVERFARGDESRTTEGNGLGLAIVNTYAAALGGAFDVAIDCDQFKASVEFLK